MEIKKCITCNNTKSLDSFYKRSSGKGIEGECKTCWSRRSTCRKLNITIEQYDKIHESNTCEICGRTEGRIKKTGEDFKLNIDHNHETKKTRGLLCLNCNTALGKFKDSVILLTKTIEYLEKYK